jgi:hypothetical protein
MGNSPRGQNWRAALPLFFDAAARAPPIHWPDRENLVSSALY